MNKKLLLIPILTGAMAFASCSEKDAPEIITNDDATFEAIASNYLDNTVIITYKNLADKAEQLVEDLEALKTNKTDARVDKACESFLEARQWWERSEAFLFGAAADFGIDPHIDSWPLDRAGLVAEMNNSAHIAAMDAEDGDEWAGAHLGPELLGFHGIEYILFANGQPKAASEIPANELIYAAAVAGDLRNKTFQLHVSWAGENGVSAERFGKVEELEFPYTVANSGLSYKENMLSAGQAGSTYRSRTQAMQAIIDGCIDIVDEVGTQKIGKPHTGEDVNYIESPYSHKSITDFYDNMVSVENAYMGGIEGRRNETKSLHSYLSTKNPTLDSRLVSAIQNAKSKISAMEAPFVLNYTHPSVDEAMTACSELADVLTEAKIEIGK